MSHLTVIQSSRTPQPINQALDFRLRQLHNAKGQSGHFPADVAPTPDDRRALQNRSSDLDGWLASVGAKEAKLMIGAVLAVMPVQGGKGSAEDAEKIQGLYVRALNDVPRFALQAACAAALKGEVGGGTWAPTPGELRQWAQRRAEIFERERQQIAGVLAAPINTAPINPARRDDLLKSTRAWLDSMKRHHTRGRMVRSDFEQAKKDLAEAEAVNAAIDAGRPDPRPMPKLGPEARRAIGLPEPQEDAA